MPIRKCILTGIVFILCCLSSFGQHAAFRDSITFPDSTVATAFVRHKGYFIRFQHKRTSVDPDDFLDLRRKAGRRLDSAHLRVKYVKAILKTRLFFQLANYADMANSFAEELMHAWYPDTSSIIVESLQIDPNDTTVKLDRLRLPTGKWQIAFVKNRRLPPSAVVVDYDSVNRRYLFLPGQLKGDKPTVTNQLMLVVDLLRHIPPAGSDKTPVLFLEKTAVDAYSVVSFYDDGIIRPNPVISFSEAEAGMLKGLKKEKRSDGKVVIAYPLEWHKTPQEFNPCKLKEY